MIKWIKALLVGIVIWYLLTIVYGFVVGILDLDDTNFAPFINSLIRSCLSLENQSSKNITLITRK